MMRALETGGIGMMTVLGRLGARLRPEDQKPAKPETSKTKERGQTRTDADTARTDADKTSPNVTNNYESTNRTS